MEILRFRKKPRDFDTFESLLEDHLNGMYRVALSLTRNPIHAEDLVHDTAVRALRFKERFELGTNFKAWIYTVLHHTFIHRYRRQKRERELLKGSTREDVDRQLHSEQSRRAAREPENTYLDHMLGDDVVRALKALPEEFRVVVTLCDLEGMSYKDIADLIDRPVGTVMSRLYRGRRLLEKRLHAVAIERGIIKIDTAGRDECDENAESDQIVGGGDPDEADGVGKNSVVNLSRYRRRRA